MNPLRQLQRRLDARLPEARARARERRRPVLLSVSFAIAPAEDVLAVAAGHAQRKDHCFFWQRPADSFAIVGRGAARVLTSAGPQRFRLLADACHALLADTLTDGEPELANPGPLFLGGFAFDDEPHGDPSWASFPAGQLVVPRLSLYQDDRRATMTVNSMVDESADASQLLAGAASELADLESAASGAAAGDRPETGPARYEAEPDRPLPDWKDSVAATVADIAAGRYEKLVLARSCDVHSNREFDCLRIVRHLQEDNPLCMTFWIRTPEGSFLGATPEPLVRRHGRAVETAAVAGSIARGNTPSIDRALAQRLVESRKDRREHGLVVRAIEDALRPVCDELSVPAEPQLLALNHVQHLYTPITGRLAEPAGVLDLIARLHPSPAVAGYPREAALAVLRGREKLERGWYAGPIGWMNARGDGEFAVALRCALVRDREAKLFAGAGIVAGSDPDAELAETRLKFQALISALMEI